MASHTKVAVFHVEAKHQENNYEAWLRTWEEVVTWLDTLNVGATHELDVTIKNTVIEYDE